MRGWPAWFGLWSAGVVGLMCALATPEARGLPPHPRSSPDQVTATAGAIAAVPVLAALLLPVLVGLVGWRVPVVLRVCLLLSAVGLAAAAFTFRGIPDVGPWQPWVTAAVALLALLGAVLGGGTRDEPDPAAARLASLGLMVVGAVAVLLAWQGLDYQQWSWWPTTTGPMWVALVLGALLVLVGAVGRALPDRVWLAVPVALLLLALGGLLLVWAGAWMLEGAMLVRHEESESGWATLPQLVAGAGALAGLVALARRWWSTAAVSVVAGCAVAAGVVARNDDLWRLMW